MSLLPVGFGASGDDYEITDSLRFRSSASAYLSRTPASTSDRTEWTWSGWVKKGPNATNLSLFSADHAGGSNAYLSMLINSSDEFQIFEYTGAAYTLRLATNALFRDPSAWYHFVCAVDTDQGTSSNRIKLYVNGVQLTSLRLATYPSSGHATYVNVSGNLHAVGATVGAITSPERYLDGYLTEVNFIDGQQLTPSDFGEYDANGTWKAKEYTGTYGTNGFYLPMKPTTQADGFNTVIYSGNGSTNHNITGVGFQPDFVWLKERSSTSFHQVLDTVRGAGKRLETNSTGAETIPSPVGLTSFDTDGFTVQNNNGYNESGQTYVAWGWDAGDNQPSTGHSSILYRGTGGAVSLKGLGFSPDLVWIKNRDGTAQNHMLFDSVRGPNLRLQSDNTATEFNQTGSLISFDADGFSFGTSTGNLNATSSNYVAWGWDAGDGDPVSNTTGDINSTVKASDATGFSIVSYTGTGANATVGHGLSTAPSVIIVKERTSTSGWFVYTSMTGAGQYLNLHSTTAASSSTTTWNNTAPTSSVFSVGTSGGTNQSSQDYIAYCFSEVSGVSKFGSYSGTGSAGNAITGLGFKPGFLMVKRTDTTGNWIMLDSTRDPFNSVDSSLVADLSNAETANNAAIAVDFNSDGFTIQGTGNGVNNSSGTYIYMAFKGSYSDYVSPLNDTGTIDSRVKANDTYGFSIVSYVGTGANATVGHGLGAAPDMLIVKNRSGVYHWIVQHSSLGATKYLTLSTTGAVTTSSAPWNNTAPTSSVFSLGTSSLSNRNGNDYIAYCFHSVAGYSKFDSYTGTGVAGVSVTTGFRPAFVMTKRTDSTSNWNISDSRRSPTGTANTTALRADTTDTENTVGTAYVKFTDTGFEITGTSTETNAAGGTYIYMAFADTADAVFNFDASGNKNNWLPNNINSNAESETTYDLMKDTPSLVDENAANFATLNPLNEPRPYVTYSDANLTVTNTTSNAHSPFISTIGMAPNSGKYYWESIGVGNSNTRNATGIGTAESMPLTTLPVGFISGQAGFYIGSGTAVYFYDESGTSTFNVAWSAGNVFMHCYDANTGKFWIGQNGVWYNSSGGTTGDPATGANPTATFTNSNTYFPLGTVYNNSGSYLYYNFGQRPFAYTPPTGFKKLNTFNLPDSTIEDGSDYFNTVTYSGTGLARSITGVGFQPDFIWWKGRNQSSSHLLMNAVVGNSRYLYSNATSAEQTDGTNVLTSFDADGYTLPNDTGGYANFSGRTYVSWNWKANGSGVSNTDGSITSTVSANTTAGFSIVTYTGNATAGATIGHGLGVSPSMWVIKKRVNNSGTSTGNWLVWHKSVSQVDRVTSTTVELNGYTGALLLNSTVGGITYGFDAQINGSGDTFIAYCFAEVEGYSAFDSYTGNGSTDGPFVYTGFRPAFVMVKLATNQINAANWQIYDTTRNTFNVIPTYLFADSSGAESDSAATYFNADILSNGFKIRAANTYGVNQSGATYIYMAFAENPFKNALAR